MTTARILLIDDHAIFRSGVRMVLNEAFPYAEIFKAGSLDEAMKCAADKLDAILLDVKLPGMNGVDGMVLLKRRWPGTPVLVLSSHDIPEVRNRARACGATAFVSKAETADKIVALLTQLLRGELPLPEGLSAADNNAQSLTPRQCEVLELLCQGMSNKLIGLRLKLSENTVRGHVQAILIFLQVSSRSEAAFAAHRRGLVD